LDLSRFERKLEAGAQFFQSQLITDFDRLESLWTKLLLAVANQFWQIFYSNLPKTLSLSIAVFQANIPQHIIDRLEQADNPLQEGIKIAAEQVQIARQICQGVHMMR